jgi:hypothetical protein
MLVGTAAAAFLVGIAAKRGLGWAGLRLALLLAKREGVRHGAAMREPEILRLRERITRLEHQLRLFPRQGHCANGGPRA